MEPSLEPCQKLSRASSYVCKTCGIQFKASTYTAFAPHCLVLHPAGTCCHYGEEKDVIDQRNSRSERSQANQGSPSGVSDPDPSAALGGWISPATSRTGPFNGGGHKRGRE